MPLPHEAPLSGYSSTIGGSAGANTHGGDVPKPDGMPDRSDADYVVTDYQELKEGLRDANAIVYIGDHIDVTQQETIWLADGVTLVGQYCDPTVAGTGYWIHHDDTDDNIYTRNVLAHRGGTPPTLYGVYGLGPRLRYFDPDHTSDQFDGLVSSFLHVYPGKSAGTFRAIGCRFTGWTMAGLELGAKNYETDAEIHRSTFTRNWMEHLGYGIEQYNGELRMDRCFFDRCRHGVSSFGYPTCAWTLTTSVVGPGPWSGHALDMHKLANNLSDGDETAGGDILIRDCSLMATTDVNGSGQEAFALRGVPDGEARIERCHFWHASRPQATNKQGNAYRQEWDGWQNFYVENCTFGPDAGGADVGAPLAEDDHDDHEPTMDILQIQGHGLRGSYRLALNGDAEPMNNTEGPDAVDTEGDQSIISGEIIGGHDSYRIDDDATLLSWRSEVPATIRREGEVVPLGRLVAVDVDRRDHSETDRSGLRRRVDQLEAFRDALTEALQ